MNIYEAFERNLEDSPKEFPLSDTASITLLPTGGEKARRLFERMMEPYAPRLQAGGKLTDDENKNLNVKYFAENIIVTWSGIKGKDGKEVKFSKENAKALLTDKKLEGFFNLIVKMASNDAAFEEKAAIEDEGNS